MPAPNPVQYLRYDQINQAKGHRHDGGDHDHPKDP